MSSIKTVRTGPTWERVEGEKRERCNAFGSGRTSASKLAASGQLGLCTVTWHLYAELVSGSASERGGWPARSVQIATVAGSPGSVASQRSNRTWLLKT